MKTAEKENQTRRPQCVANRADGAASQYRSCSIMWAAKQENFQPAEKCFLVTSPFIELTEEVEQGTPNNCRGNSLLVTFLGASCELAPLGSNSFGWQWVAPPTHCAIIRNVSSHVDMETYVVGITYAIAAITSPHSTRTCRAQIAQL